MMKRSHTLSNLTLIPISFLFLGIAPFSCENRALNSASDEIQEAFQRPEPAPTQPPNPQPAAVVNSDLDETDSASEQVLPEPKAVQMLSDIQIDAPEVYLGRGLSRITAGHWAIAKRDLDHAYALVAQAQAKANAMGEDGLDPEAEAQRKRLRARIAFSLGKVALEEERYEDAIVEFSRALRDDPFDDDARWNLELAWHMQNPSCLKRDDDHEPDDTFTEAKPYDPEKGTERLLCPKDEDWYSYSPQQPGSGIFATVKGSIVKHDGDEVRQIVLEMIDARTQTSIHQKTLAGDTVKVGRRLLSNANEVRFVLKGDGTGEFAYEISIEEIPPCAQMDDDHEPDDGPNTAQPIGEGQQKERLLCPNNQDWYSIQGEKEMDLYVRIRGEITEYTGDEKRQLGLALFGPTSEQPLRVVSLKDEELRLGFQGLPEDGTYVFGIWGDGDGEFKYDMDIIVTPPCPEDDAREENDEIEQAYMLKDETPPQEKAAMPDQPQPPQGFQGTVANLKACPDDLDYYQLLVPPNTEVELSAIYDVKRAPLVFERILEDGTTQPARESKDGKVIKLPTEETEVTYTFMLKTETDKENNYFLRWAPPQEEGDQDQDNQEQQNEQQNQDEQSQQDQQQQQQQQPQELSGEALLDALDQQERNPQLEKALRERRVIPDLEDY